MFLQPIDTFVTSSLQPSPEVSVLLATSEHTPLVLPQLNPSHGASDVPAVRRASCPRDQSSQCTAQSTHATWPGALRRAGEPGAGWDHALSSFEVQTSQGRKSHAALRFSFSLKNMKESDNYFYLPPNCTNYQPISSQYDRHRLSKTHRDKLALIGFPLAV